MKNISKDSDASYITLLTYSSWLVAGTWLIYTGIMLLYKPPRPDNAVFNIFFGIVRILIGIHALLTARITAVGAHKPQRLTTRVMTYLILTMLVVLPLLLFVIQTSMIIFGTYQPDEHYSESLGKLIFVAVCYILAVIYADRRLKK